MSKVLVERKRVTDKTELGLRKEYYRNRYARIKHRGKKEIFLVVGYNKVARLKIDPKELNRKK